MSATRRGPSSAARSRWGRASCAQYSRPEHVELDHLLPLLQRRADRLAEQHHAGVVDERVEPAELGHRALNGTGRLLLVGDVALQHQRGAAPVADAGRERLHPVLAPCRQCHRRAVIRERGGGGRADAARGPRHQRNGALQYWFHRELTFSRSSPSAPAIPPAHAQRTAPGAAEPDSPAPR